MASWKNEIINSSTTEFELWRNAGPSALQLQETTGMLKRNKKTKNMTYTSYD